jgi:hypothetical protein
MGYFPRLEAPMVADVATPIFQGFAERRRRKLEDVQEGRIERAEERTLADRLAKAEQDKIDRDREAIKHTSEMKTAKLEQDELYRKFRDDYVMNFDTSSPEAFERDLVTKGPQFERALVENFGYTPEEAEHRMKAAIMSGQVSYENIKKIKRATTLKGLSKPPKGYRYDENYELEEIPGAPPPKGEGEKTFEVKIEKLMDVNPGLTEDEATGMVVGTTKVVTDPVSGESMIVNMVDNTSRPLNISPDKQEPPETIPEEEPILGKTLWEDAELSTGPISALRHGASVASGIVGGPVASQTEQARQRSKTSTNELIRALSINPRFPVGEINRIKEEISIDPQVLDNPKLLKDRMIAIDESLHRRVRNEKRAANDRTLPINQRREARRAVKDIEDFIDVMGVPPRYTTEIYEELPAGEQYIDPNGILRIKKAK